MRVKIDCREKDLIPICKNINEEFNYNISIETKSLLLGDIIIEDDNGNEIIMIERKTWKDLAASIRDGRYAEQSFRLNNCELHNHNIIYLIEGDLKYYNDKFTRIGKKALISAITSIHFTKGFSLYKTNNLTESAEWILQMVTKIQKDKAKSFYIDTGENKVVENYSSVCKRAKKSNISKDNIGEIMLAQIPGISNTVAVLINQKYGSIKNLINALENNPNELNDLKVEVKGGKERRINKTCISNIYEYLLGETNCIQIDTSEI